MQSKKKCKNIKFIIDENKFEAKPYQILIFEALVSGQDKGKTHIEDALIMANYCVNFSDKKILPKTILEQEESTEYFNLAASALLKIGILEDLKALSEPSPIYKPTTK